MLSKLTYNIELVAEATTNAVTVADSRHADHRGLVGYLLFS